MNLQSEKFQINIPLTAHVKAEQFRCHQSCSERAKQVYLNTLAVSVVNRYLNHIGWSTSLEKSESWNPVSQMMMDIADLVIPSYGRLECRYVLAGSDCVVIPPEVWSGRIGYVVVQLDSSLKTASVLGYLEQVTQYEISLSQLKVLCDFPTFLSQQKKLKPAQRSDLSSWLSGMVTQSWQQLDELFTPPVAINFRCRNNLLESKVTSQPEVSRVKLIQFDNETQETIALILNVQPHEDSEFNVSITVCNYEHQNYLPNGLELVIVDQVHRPVMSAQASETKTIEFCFSGEQGEHFTVEVALNEKFQTENFVI